MAVSQRNFIKLLKLTNLRQSSTAAQAMPVHEDIHQSFRTREDNPEYHGMQHINRIYTIPNNDLKMITCQGLITMYMKQFKTFAEASILVRKPAVEIISYLNQADYSKPVNKYVLYGEDGTGKTSTMLHTLHYAYTKGQIIVHVPWIRSWFDGPKETANSITKTNKIDLPLHAAAWLRNFKTQNQHILNKADIKLSATHEWSATENSAKDSSLMDMIDFGISRIKFASNVIIKLMSELKQASTLGKCKVLVAIDGYNALFSQQTNIFNDNKQMVPASQVSLTEAFLDITKSDWCNGQVIVTVDKMATQENAESHFPRYLLTNEGFDHLDPFLPISVENYTEDEFNTVIEYYKNRKWIRNLSSDGQKELQLLSGGNPYKLMEYCKHL
ncbi:28S ribosomal protein S29, mitochondrial [Trichogramma pretiosum]|uniref:28S ribosomal protein S29, mitochondrial n=1 Tax=Trichogramma pretiosum TaxID=7493 RepID=UPI0006C9D11B|nr:28S ribosomal protein S29, mitochondrial [Trichogramma pretiosum]